MRRVPWLAVVVLGLSLGLGFEATAGAQPRRGGGGSAATATERREQIKKKIRAMRAYTLTEELALDEQTAGKLFPVLSRYDDETDKLLEKRVDVQRRLRHADSLKDPKAIEQLLDEAVANQRSFWDLEDKRVADLRKILTPIQAASLLVVLPALERKIQNQLRKAIVQQRAAGAASDADDDDREPDEFGPPPPKPPRHREPTPAARDTPSNAPGSISKCSPYDESCR